jgi:hypothetical protein
MCQEMANNNKADKFERALYAALCGSLAPLMRYAPLDDWRKAQGRRPRIFPFITSTNCFPIHSICGSWEDALWAFFKVMLEAKLEKALDGRDTTLDTFEGARLLRVRLRKTALVHDMIRHHSSCRAFSRHSSPARRRIERGDGECGANPSRRF